MAALLALGLAACTETEVKTVEVPVPVPGEIPACSLDYPIGLCPTGQTCKAGVCVASVTPEPVDPCTVKVNTVQPTLKFAVDFAAATDTAGRIAPSGKVLGTGAAAYTYDDDANTATPAVEVPFTKKSKITVDGLDFRDLNANGTLEKYEDWRYSDVCRAKDLVARMAVKEKTGLMGESSSIGSGTTDGIFAQSTINALFVENRRQALIRLADITPTQYQTYVNNLQAIVEGSKWGIPFAITADPVHFVTQSTSAAGVQTLSITPAVSQWPNPMGLGAINSADVAFQYGDTVRKDFMGIGFRWQLGPMMDSATEPRWARFITMFGEQPDHVGKIGKEVILGFQAGKAGGLRGGIAATMKHFPGAGPDEDGRDSHGYRGKYNVYPGGNFDNHVKPFTFAIDAGAAAVMPCYSIEKGIYEWNPEQFGTAFSYGMITRLLKNELGFDGMVTSDWGTMSGAAFGVEALSQPERAAIFVKAGSHQLGSDSVTIVQAAYDQGFLTEAEINGAATKILEMTFKLGLFENPYTSDAMTALARNAEAMQNGFDAQKKAIVLVQNAGTTNPGRLPISQTRYSDVAGGTAGAPDVGEFASDADKDGTIEVFFDGVTDALNGADRYSTAPINALTGLSPVLAADYDYRAAGAGTAGTAGFKLPIVAAATAADADIAVLRITARKGTYSGLDAGVPLSFDAPYPGINTDSGRAPAVKDAQKVIDLFRIRDGYKKADGTVVPAAKATLRIVLVMHMDRPSPVTPFINGLKTLDERVGCDPAGSDAAKELCYPVVSDDANVNPVAVTTTTATAHAGVDTFLVEFGAYDRAVLDFIFNKNVPTNPAGYAYGAARLPVEFPRNEKAVNEQYEDMPNDSYFPLFVTGTGSALPAN
ncbi:MAG: glycoside hydrolase family 3 N-terminal domain-containing protein [Anaeromyxobacter sp.]